MAFVTQSPTCPLWPFLWCSLITDTVFRVHPHSGHLITRGCGLSPFIYSALVEGVSRRRRVFHRHTDKYPCLYELSILYICMLFHSSSLYVELLGWGFSFQNVINVVFIMIWWYLVLALIIICFWPCKTSTHGQMTVRLRLKYLVTKLLLICK